MRFKPQFDGIRCGILMQGVYLFISPGVTRETEPNTIISVARDIDSAV